MSDLNSEIEKQDGPIFKVACPTCGAPAGEHCTGTGQRHHYESIYVHGFRLFQENPDVPLSQATLCHKSRNDAVRDAVPEAWRPIRVGIDCPPMEPVGIFARNTTPTFRTPADLMAAIRMTAEDLRDLS